LFKECKVCGQLKPLDDFYRSPGMRDGYRNDCKTCNLAAQRARYDSAVSVARATRWQKANPERHAAFQAEYRNRPERKRAMRDLYYRREFGISADDVDVMIAAQGSQCAICGTAPTRFASWNVDHDHETGRIRGMLCSRCNQGVGLFHEDVDRHRAAADYLERASR